MIGVSLLVEDAEQIPLARLSKGKAIESALPLKPMLAVLILAQGNDGIHRSILALPGYAHHGHRSFISDGRPSSAAANAGVHGSFLVCAAARGSASPRACTLPSEGLAARDTVRSAPRVRQGWTALTALLVSVLDQIAASSAWGHYRDGVADILSEQRSAYRRCD